MYGHVWSVDAAVHNYRKVLGDRGKERMGVGDRFNEGQGRGEVR